MLHLYLQKKMIVAGIWLLRMVASATAGSRRHGGKKEKKKKHGNFVSG